MVEELKQHLGSPHEEGSNYAVFQIERPIEAKVFDVSITGGPDLSIDLHFYFTEETRQKMLLLSKWPVRQSEVSWLQQELLQIGGAVSSVHTNWLYDTPKLVYLQWQIKRPAAQLGKELAELIKKLQERKQK